MAQHAIVLHDGGPGSEELRLSSILDFFGISSEAVPVSKIVEALPRLEASRGYAVFGSLGALATAEDSSGVDALIRRSRAVYLWSTPDRGVCERALRRLTGEVGWSLRQAPSGAVSIEVSDGFPELTGPMSGIEISARSASGDSLLLPGEKPDFAPLISADGAPVFVQLLREGPPFFLCASSEVPDLDEPVRGGFYDVKEHFRSAVPLVMFLRWAFKEVVWRPQEYGACLIIDDPLLRSRYGFCDFPKLRDLMRGYGFTTNIAFIPWNWRRTTRSAADFFRAESGHFSVSIHGCDHMGGEFGGASSDDLHDKAGLALSRMRNHAARTGIQHDPIMVFPQGVFSSECPAALRRNGFVAAVNTEVTPVDRENARTRIRDVWDVAILRYGAFPIFTRRYPFHGLENFAFDLLLGKPCLIVTHHDFFRDDCAGPIDLIEKLSSLNCSLRWRSLGGVVRRACRARILGDGLLEAEMYGGELVVANPSDQSVEVRIRKKRAAEWSVREVLRGGRKVECGTEGRDLVFAGRLGPWGEELFQVFHQQSPEWSRPARSIRYELSVAARRLLSELRDDYLSRSRFLETAAAGLGRTLRRRGGGWE